MFAKNALYFKLIDRENLSIKIFCKQDFILYDQTLRFELKRIHGLGAIVKKPEEKGYFLI